MIVLNFCLISIAIISIPFIWWYLFLLKYKSFNNIPGPKLLPLIGNATQIGNSPYEFKKNIVKFRETYGEIFKIYIGMELHLVVSSPEWMEFIMSSNEHISKSNGYDLIKPWLGDGLLVSTGNKWKSRRKIITPTFHFKILEQFNEVFNSAGNILIEKLSNEIDNPSFDIYPYINLCSLDIICETSMGIKINAQLNENIEYVNAVRRFLEIFSNRFFSSWERFDLLFQMSPKYKEFVKILNILHHFTNQVIDKRRQQLKERKQNNVDKINDEGIKIKTALLDMLLESESSNLLTNEDIREEINTFMFEGHDTVSSGVSFAILALAKNPNIQQTLYEEILNTVGPNKDEYITTQHLQEMKYLDRVVKESQRIYPSVPAIERKIEKEFEFNNYKIPVGVTIAMFIYGMHHSEEIYPNPEKFDPDRFLIDNQSSRHNYAFIPFSAGARNCIGQKFALLEMKSSIVKMVKNFKILLAPGFKEKLGFTGVLKSYNGVCVRLERREN